MNLPFASRKNAKNFSKVTASMTDLAQVLTKIVFNELTSMKNILFIENNGQIKKIDLLQCGS
jgi:hypothetical protein